MRFMLISAVARELGVSVDWLRRAEKDGRIPRARRHLSGWRVYTDQDVVVIQNLLIPSEPGRPG